MSTIEYTLLAFSSLFVIVDPIAVIPAFLGMTPLDTPAQRERMARLASLVMAGVLLTFALTGQLIFKLLGITLPAFQIAGSIVLLLVALDMLRAQRSRVQQTPEEQEAGTHKVDVAVTPLAIPMLSGPGAISTVVLLRGQAEGVAMTVALCASIAGVCASSYVILRLSSKGAQWINPIAMKITTRIMGLLLAAVACQFMINALRDLGVVPR
ncbi:MAG: multiple antibiotic resistance protein [Verrucomicrobiota bacterium]|jgi:multiple antibiotic resistance protein